MKSYDLVVNSITPSFETLDRDKSGRVVSTGTMYRSVIGTYYNCSIEVQPKSNVAESYQDYDFLLLLLVNAKRNKGFIWVQLPYLQGTITQEMYCASVSRPVLRKYRKGEKHQNNAKRQVYKYGPMSINLVARKKLPDTALNITSTEMLYRDFK